jgi:DNA-binding GntR family transcriptional regulator
MSVSLILLRDSVYENIKQDILSGVLAPGQRIQETPLAERFKTSKTPVREALARLVQESLLEVFPRVGYVVTDCTVEDAQAVLDFRCILELAAADAAARYITDAELTQLEAMSELDFRSKDTLTYRGFIEQNRRFHRVIAQASRNQYLLEAIEQVFDKVDRLLHYRLDVSESDVERLRSEHRDVVSALRTRDPENVRKAVLLGLDKTKAEVLEVLMTGDQRAVCDPLGLVGSGSLL